MKVRVFLLLAAIAGGVSPWLPWQVWEPHQYDGWSMSGGTPGMMTFCAFVAALLCSLYRPLWYVRAVLFGCGMVAVIAPARAVGEMLKASRELSHSLLAAERAQATLARPGIGAWIAMGASLALVIGAFAWKRPRPGGAAPLPKAKLV